MLQAHTAASCWASHQPASHTKPFSRLLSIYFLPACICAWDWFDPGALILVELLDVYMGPPLEPVKSLLYSIPSTQEMCGRCVFHAVRSAIAVNVIESLHWAFFCCCFRFVSVNIFQTFVRNTQSYFSPFRNRFQIRSFNWNLFQSILSKIGGFSVHVGTS